MKRYVILFWTGVTLAVVIAVAWAIYPAYLEKVKLERKLANIKEAQRKQEMVYLNLRKEEALLEENDPVYLEKFVRDTFGWCRKGEVVYRFNERGQE